MERRLLSTQDVFDVMELDPIDQKFAAVERATGLSREELSAIPFVEFNACLQKVLEENGLD